MKDLSLHILDIVQNSISAHATLIEVDITEDPKTNTYTLRIADNGKGIPPEMLDKVLDPYGTTRTTRKVGLGLPLLKQNAERANGHLHISSTLQVGTEVITVFEYDHIDRIPIGDIAGTILMLASMNPTLEFVYKHQTSEGEFIFDTREVKAMLENVPINELSIQKDLKEFIQENINAIHYTH